MCQINIGVYIGSDEANYSGIFCSTLIYRNKCLDFRGSLHISFIKDHKVIDKIIDHLKLTFKAERPPPAQAQLSMAAEERSEYI